MSPTLPPSTSGGGGSKRSSGRAAALALVAQFLDTRTRLYAGVEVAEDPQKLAAARRAVNCKKEGRERRSDACN